MFGGLRSRLAGQFLWRLVVMLMALTALFFVWLAALGVTVLLSENYDNSAPGRFIRDVVAATRTADGTATLAPEQRDQLRRAGAWLQVLDKSGREILSVDRPAQVPIAYAPGQLVMLRVSSGRYGQRQVMTWFEQRGGQDVTWVVGRPIPKSGPGSKSWPVFLSVRAALFGGAGLLALAGLGVVLLVGWLFGKRLSQPLEHMMAWLRALAAGDYREPIGPTGTPVSRDESGQLRKPYGVYREVFGALDTLTGELRDAEAERGRVERAREEWLAGVTHDLRTPLSSVRGYAEVLASDYDFDPASVRLQASVIRGQALHMDTLLDDLNLSFRLRAEALPLSPQGVDLVELVREATVELANDPRADGRDVSFDAAAGPVEAHVDAGWFRRALRNLLVNAVAHNPEGTHVRVAVEREGAEAVVTVADDGRGMDPETVTRLFDRYYRGTATAEDEGTGLGMAISRQLVEAHGGRIDVESAPGEGTTMRVRLPL
jgi:signal transduction histidine kinase